MKFTFNLDTMKGLGHINRVTVRQGEVIPLRVSITDDGAAFDFTDKRLEFCCIRPDGHWCHIADSLEHIGQTNIWNVELPTEVTDVAGFINLAYFRIMSDDDQEYMLTTEVFQIVVDPSATCRVKLNPYSDQVTRLILAFEALIKAYGKWIDEKESEIKALLEYFQAEFEAAEKLRDDRYNASMERYENIFRDAKNVVDEALHNNFDPVAKLYLDSWYDKPGGIVSYDWFQEWQLAHGSEPFMTDEAFLAVVMGDE